MAGSYDAAIDALQAGSREALAATPADRVDKVIPAP